MFECAMLLLNVIFLLSGSASSLCNSSGKWTDTCQMCVPANQTEVVHRTCVGDCTFDVGNRCQYKLDDSWTIKNGSYAFTMGNRTLLTGGQDDDFYAFFDPPKTTGYVDPMFSSPVLPGGAACLAFYYTLPAGTATLHVRTRTEDNVTLELWNVTGSRIKNWTRIDGLVLWQSNEYFVEYVAKTQANAFIGIDNIHLESFYCDIGYSLNRSEVNEYCNTSRTEFPSCELVDCGNFPALTNGNVSADSTTYGSTATVQCKAGYILNGSGTSECGSDGKWNLTGTTCEPVDMNLNNWELTVYGTVTDPLEGNASESSSSSIGLIVGVVVGIVYGRRLV